MKTGIELIQEERQRQILKEGWDAYHDDQHKKCELAIAAKCYMIAGKSGDLDEEPPSDWPWDAGWWKPSTPVRCLIKAGALYLAEIDRKSRLKRRFSKGHYMRRINEIADKIDAMIKYS